MPEVKVFAGSGNMMVAEAYRQANPEVCIAYPITPQTTIIEGFDKFVADGKVKTEFVTTESEHSAMSACIGACAAGARTVTATSSQGLALMWEELYIAAGMRLPIIMANANRALSAPINIHGDHSDLMGARDAGWIILIAENAQEAYDNTVVSFRVAEDIRVQLPIMTTLDGFITTHAMERCEILDDATVGAFIGEREAVNPLLDTDHPVSHGMFANLGGSYMQLRYAQRLAIDASAAVIKEVGDEWAEICGRPFDMVETWGMEDAEYAIVLMGSATGNARHVARDLRKNGKKVGVVRIRVYRPFPFEEVAAAVAGCKAIAVLDRADALGAQYGPLGLDVSSALYEQANRPKIKNYIYGLGGADIPLSLMYDVYENLEGVVAGTVDTKLEFLGNR